MKMADKNMTTTTGSYDLVAVHRSRKRRLRLIEMTAFGLLLIVAIVTMVLAILLLVKISNNNNEKVETISTTTTTTPTVQTPNINSRSVMQPSDSRFEAFNASAHLFLEAIDNTKDPCQDFYSYACGSWVAKNGSVSFGEVNMRNFELQLNAMNNGQYNKTSNPLPVRQTAWFYSTCVNEGAHLLQDFGNGSVVINWINKFKNLTGLDFPLLDFPNDNKIDHDGEKEKNVAWPTAHQLGLALGFLSGTIGTDTLISFYIDTDWTSPYNDSTAYRLYIDQATLYFADSTYANGTWQSYEKAYKEHIMKQMLYLAGKLNISLTNATLERDIDDMIELEVTMARHMKTDETVRRKQMRSYNLHSKEQAAKKWHFIDWRAYFQQISLTASKDVQKLVVLDEGFRFSVTEMQFLDTMGSVLTGTGPYKWRPRAVLNYLLWRLVDAEQFFLMDGTLKQVRDLRNPRHKVSINRPERLNKFRHKLGGSLNQGICLSMSRDYMMYVNARIFADALYEDRGVSVKSHVLVYIESILNGFQSMLDQLTWMSAQSKRQAYAKVTNLVKNVAFPDFVYNDTSLGDYYRDLKIKNTDTYEMMLNELKRWTVWTSFNKLLTEGAIDRRDFAGPPGIVNAWYQPELNSITFPAGILQRPFYDPKFPRAVNYGALGVVAGHELTHGFDDEGVQWDGLGVLSNWMDHKSSEGFGRMARCVIDEYSCFCPLNQSETSFGPRCLNGARNQGENIADNGGIHAAWRAYKTETALNGPEPELPDRFMSRFSQDQLFFLSFARVWCRKRPTAGQFLSQILSDAHSPAEYRVLGTVQNFAAFQTAFNCRTGDPMSLGRGKHCDVWVGDNNRGASVWHEC